jgi:exodeoxyribonuclease V beta subunit
MLAPPPFDPTQPLAEGLTVLEASAGTGKTHAVASLVVAEVADGRPLDEMLVVTFTRKATGTLRERVWKRLASAVAALDSGARATTDPLLAHLAEGSDEDIARRRARLAGALSDFDSATIATTHGFCQQVLAGLGVAGDAERDLEFLEDVSSLVEDAVNDLFVRRFHAGGHVLFDRKEARRIAKAVIDNPDAEIAGVDRSSEAAVLRRRFAVTLRQRIRDQKRRSRLVTYDDLLTRLATSIDDPVRGAMVAERLRRRFSMAVVDEFQDTDTVQWRILRAAFGAPPSRLVLVGDPKQAIYAFRGGDVFAYLEATRGASKLGLDVSWRADQPLLDAIDTFFARAQLGDPIITHRPLQARPGAEQRRLVGPAIGAPLTIRIVDRRTGPVTRTKYGYAEKASARRLIARDLAAEAVRILSAGTRIVERDEHGIADLGRLLDPGDLAVLVRRHSDAETVRDALLAADVPALVYGGAGVVSTQAAHDWLDLLRALEQPASTSRVRAVARSPFFGWDAARLATAHDDEWDTVDERLRDWAITLQAAGVAGLLYQIEAAESLTARLLGSTGGDRRLSDLQHVAELLQGHQAAHPSSAAGLARWWADQVASVPRADTNSVRRRLESDAAAVSVQTIHSAKGLEFPVVLLPSLWEGPWTDDEAPPVFHDGDGRRCIGVGGTGDLHDNQMAAAKRERASEELRLLYVAMTRARHQVVLWWACGNDARDSPFGRILLGRDQATGAVPDRLPAFPEEKAVRAAMDALSHREPGIVAVEVDEPPRRHFQAPQNAGADLDVSTFDRSFDRTWTRTSYSGLTAMMGHVSRVALGASEVAEVDERAKLDEPDVSPARSEPDAATPRALALPVRPLPLGDVPAGARVGTLVHEILERTDFAAADLPAALSRAAAQMGARRLLEGHTDALVAGLAAALKTPLGPLFNERSLCDMARGDRLDELAFDLPLAGGNTPAGAVTMAAVADVFATALPSDDPIHGYADRLRDPKLAAKVRGFLTGSIDLIARVAGRHVVVDYKTNRLAPPGEQLTASHYRPEALLAVMYEGHYPLQAALYLVAVHRYLRWRLPRYNPASHLGGAAYLFLRGMSGPDAALTGGQSAGVFVWTPPAGFVIQLSDLLDQGTP